MKLLKLIDPIELYQKKCQRFAKSKHCPDYLKDFYRRPLPDSKSYIDECKFTSIDFETTGINPKEDYVLSIGGIQIVDNAIDFKTCFHYFVNNSKYIKSDSAVINMITPELLLDGKDTKVAMLELLDRISGGLVLVHCKFIETNFIKQTLGLKSRDPLPFLVLDTMSIERKLNHSTNSNDVRLAIIREKRGFPAYDGHNALVDSLSTAELFLAQLKDVFGTKRPTVKPIYKRSL